MPVRLRPRDSSTAPPEAVLSRHRSGSTSQHRPVQVPVVRLELEGGGECGNCEDGDGRGDSKGTYCTARSSARSDISGGGDGGGGGRNCYGIAGLISGELYFRCSQYDDGLRRIRQRQKRQQGGNTALSGGWEKDRGSTIGVTSCSAVLPSSITAWLDSTDPSDAEKAEQRCLEALRLLSTVRNHMANARKQRLTVLGQEGKAGKVVS